MSGMVIVGGGFAAANAVDQLRESGYEGEITVVAGEPHYPYQRPPLSKGYLQGGEGEDAVFAHPESWYRENNVTVRVGVAATGLDTAAHELQLADGSKLGYDKLLIATGSAARQLPIPGHDLPGVHTLRTLDDSNALAAQLREGGKRLVLIGSGWIGMEVAASAVALGNSVTILERGDVPLEAALGPVLGKEFQKLHESHGVTFHMGASVERIAGTDRAEAVIADGQAIPADLVLIGVGAVPNTDLAKAAGIDVDNGILVDSSLRTSAPDVYAAGDVANIDHAGAAHRIRSEHWAVAMATGKAAARAMLGETVSYSEIPYFYTDQYDLGMELSGYPHLMRDAEIVIRGDLGSREYIAFWLRGGIVVAGMNVNIWDVNEDVQRLVRSATKVDRAALTNPEVPLSDLLPA